MIGKEIVYKVIRTGFLSRSTTIRISPIGQVVVRVPSWVPLSEIERFIQLKSSWINKQLNRFVPRQKVETKKFTDGENHLFFGQELPLKITRLPYISRCRLKLNQDSFEAVVPLTHTSSKQKKDLKELMLNLYLEHGKKIINEKVYFYSKKLGVTYNRIVLKNVSSIWGSCSRLNNLNFNRKLTMAPHQVVEYVVIHEVCHLVHRNHSHDFWSQVKELCPDYKSHIRWLKDNHHLLTI